MEGRVPPAGGHETDHNPLVAPLPPPPPLAYHSETYVIQVPKDQIYRIPPPENAIIAERLRQPGMRNKKKSHCCSLCLLVTAVILVVLALIGIAITALYFVFSPKAPSFWVAQALVKYPKSSSTHKHSSPPGYEIFLRAKNPNNFMGIYYRTGGVATLSFKGKKIAKGKFPKPYQDMKKSMKIKVVLKGSNPPLPRQMEKSMKDKKSKQPIILALNVKFQVKMRLGTMKTWIIDTDVACKFKVSKLGVGSRILWQKCHTEFES